MHYIYSTPYPQLNNKLFISFSFLSLQGVQIANTTKLLGYTSMYPIGRHVPTRQQSIKNPSRNKDITRCGKNIFKENNTYKYVKLTIRWNPFGSIPVRLFPCTFLQYKIREIWTIHSFTNTS